MADKYPHLREAYLKKADLRRGFTDIAKDKVKVAKVLDDIDAKCDQFEECLRKSGQGKATVN